MLFTYHIHFNLANLGAATLAHDFTYDFAFQSVWAANVIAKLTLNLADYEIVCDQTGEIMTCDPDTGESLD